MIKYPCTLPDHLIAVELITYLDVIQSSRPPTPGEHAVHIGFVGIGAMGRFMARNLANSKRSHPAGSPPVLIFNRTRSKSEDLVKEVGEQRIRIADSPAQVVQECDIIITNLGSDEAVKSFYVQFAEALKKNKPTRRKIFVETSTIYPALASELDELIYGPHVQFVTSPVFGAPPAADSAQLIIAMSGDYRSKKELAYIFVPTIGRKVIDLGGNIEKAPTFKLIGNSMIIGYLETMSESYTLAEKSGIGAQAASELLAELMGGKNPFEHYSKKLLEDDFDGAKGFSIDGGIKDASHIRRLVTLHNAPMPVVDAAHQHMVTARALHESHKRAGHSEFPTLDWSAMVVGSRVGAGLPGFDSHKNANRVERED